MSSYYRTVPHPTYRTKLVDHYDYGYDYDYIPAPVPPARPRRSTTLPSPSKTFYASTNTSSRPSYYPAPNRSRRTITLDNFLEYHAHPQNSLLEFDVLLPTSEARRASSSSSTHTLSTRDRARPATSPPLPYLHLTCDLLPWSIDIYPSSSIHGYVTVGDVLDGIYYALRHHISKSEWIATGESTRQAVQQAFYRRVGRTQCHREWKEEYASGLRRADWVGRKTLFAGLVRGSGRERGPEEWTLVLRQPEKSVKFRSGS